MPYIIAETEPVYWTVGQPAIVSGFTEVTGCTVTGLVMVSDTNPNTYLGKLDSSDFPQLPDSGWLEVNDIYDYNGVLVMVRQSHNRTIYPPEETPALFVVYRPDASGVLDWIAGEPVTVGMHRLYDAIEYVCLQSHVTQLDWTPPATPALWQVYVETHAIAEWVQPTGAHDAYNIGDQVTYVGHLWESLINANVWSPTVYPAGWRDLGVYP